MNNNEIINIISIIPIFLKIVNMLWEKPDFFKNKVKLISKESRISIFFINGNLLLNCYYSGGSFGKIVGYIKFFRLIKSLIID